MACSSMVGSKCVAQTIRDANHHNIGRISPTGTVRDGDSRPLGFFDRDGVIRNKGNKQKVKGGNLINRPFFKGADNERL